MKTQLRKQIILEFRINMPYGFYIKDNIAIPYNRNYSNLGRYEKYDFDFNNVQGCEDIVMYNDGTNPYSGWFKKVPDVKLLENYNKKYDDIKNKYKIM